MTALAAASNRWFKRAEKKRTRIVKNTSQVYKLGFAVIESTTGHIIAATTVLTNKFAGVVKESLLGNGVLKVDTYLDGEFEFAKSGTLVQANMGEPVCAIDDNTVAPALSTYASPTGVANSAFTLVSKIPGANITFQLAEEGASQTLMVRASGGNGSYVLYVRAKTTAGSAQDNTTTELITAIQADPLANSLVTIALVGGHSGAGKPAAIAATNLTMPGPIVGKLSEIRGSLVGVCIDGYAN